MKRKLIYWPSPALRDVSRAVDPTLDRVQVLELIADMQETMHAHRGAGLSAIQVGVPLRVFIGGPISQNFGGPQAFINPVLVSTGGYLVQMNEGCLSVPGFFEKMKRWTEVTVTYRDETFALHENVKFQGFNAHLIQHELEHLDGKLYLDHLSKPRRSALLGNMQALKRAGKLR